LSSETVHGWGGGPGAPVQLARPDDEHALRAVLADDGACAAGAITRGMGRSYGDAAQLRGGLVVDTTRLNGYELDAERGILTAQAGITIHELLPVLVARGWILPVLPGTQHVTIGGMIASDIHGKNHGDAGSFGRYVLRLGLLTSTGELRELAPGEEDGAFEATVGGMGLTGTILWAEVRLRPVAGPLMSVDTDRAEDLDGILTLLQAPGGRHRVAWLDLLGGPGRVRGVVTRAEYADAAAQSRANGRADVLVKATVPGWWPGILPRGGVRVFNALRFGTSPAEQRGHLEPVGLHMFPLDRLAAWPRLYGRAGFVQYQFVVPPGEERVLERVLETLSAYRVPSFLAVLKDFGDAGTAPLSFPMRGWTLALDLPRSAANLEPALWRCDELVAAAGGRVYLSKDSRLRPELLPTMYPRLDEWREAQARVDPVGLWRSDLALRVGLLSIGRPEAHSAPARTAQPSGSAQPMRTAGPATEARRVLVIGGSSEIGLAIVRRMAAEGPVTPYLLGRDADALERALAALRRDGCTGGATGVHEATDTAAAQAAIAQARATLGSIDVVVLATGVLGGQAGLDADRAESADVLRVTFLGAAMLLMAALESLRAQGHGSLVVLSSVAVERARATNAVYGAAKAGLDALAQGLSDGIAGSGVEVIVVRPGFVTTRMTAGLDPAPFATTPEAVADAAVRALGHGSRTIWVPPVLHAVFAILRHLPRPVYRRLPL
jgi:decaprenylphospho-beta-D-ribofuranose 2-oxidase